MPNFLFVLTDDQRYDALGCTGNPYIVTPAFDALAARGVRFTQTFATTSICAPSRATCLTGRYGSQNGVPSMQKQELNEGEPSFVEPLRGADYLTGYVGKWHLRRPVDPSQAGFDRSVMCSGNGPHYDREVSEDGQKRIAKGFIEDYFADRCIEFLEFAASSHRPFFLQYSTQVPHMDHEFSWKPKPETWALYRDINPPLPTSWSDDLSGKPPYLKLSRSRQQALRYGYDDPEAVRRHIREYYAATTDMDRAFGRVKESLDRLGLTESTYVVVIGDNGWIIGEHGFTSKVLAYEESIRIPLLIAGPGIQPGVRDELVLNADLASTFIDLAGLDPLPRQHGQSLAPLLQGQESSWRNAVLYESFESPSLGAWPHLAVRTKRWKYIQTFDQEDSANLAFEELYDLDTDPSELINHAGEPTHSKIRSELAGRLRNLRERVTADRQV